MFKLSRGRAALAGAFALCVSSGLVAMPAQPRFNRDDADDAGWSHSITPGTH